MDSQRLWVIEQLLTKGYVSRNECLANYISRLSDIIFKLKEKGWEFETKKVYTSPKHYDFHYVLEARPVKASYYNVEL